MRKRPIITHLLVIILSLSIPMVSGQAASNQIDKSQANSGVIKINYQDGEGVVTAVRISKGEVNYDYILGGSNIFPLQSGDGVYSISILENVEGKKFKQVATDTVTLESINPNDVYLQSIQMINWDNKMEAIKKAKELTKKAKSDEEKVVAIYNYIMKINYDYEKASTIKSNYIPDIDATLELKKGICYDYASLFAAMLRSLEIPTKLVMGYKDDIKEYHAWNQVYVQDTSEWITIDTTYDAGLKKGNSSTTMVKDASVYEIDKEY